MYFTQIINLNDNSIFRLYCCLYVVLKQLCLLLQVAHHVDWTTCIILNYPEKFTTIFSSEAYMWQHMNQWLPPRIHFPCISCQLKVVSNLIQYSYAVIFCSATTLSDYFKKYMYCNLSLLRQYVECPLFPVNVNTHKYFLSSTFPPSFA